MKALASPLGRKQGWQGAGGPWAQSVLQPSGCSSCSARLRTCGLSDYLCFLRVGREGGKGVGQPREGQLLCTPLLHSSLLQHRLSCPLPKLQGRSRGSQEKCGPRFTDSLGRCTELSGQSRSSGSSQPQETELLSPFHRRVNRGSEKPRLVEQVY